MRGGEGVQVAIAPKVDGRIAEIDAVQGVALDHHCCERGDHLAALIEHLRLLVQGLIEDAGKGAERLLRRPGARACGVVLDE
jgi:hypothetical protein